MWNKKKYKFYSNTFIVTSPNAYVTLLNHCKSNTILTTNIEQEYGVEDLLSHSVDAFF